MFIRLSLMTCVLAVSWFYSVLMLPPSDREIRAAALRLNLGDATGRPPAYGSLSGHPRRGKRAFKRPPAKNRLPGAPAFLDLRRAVVRS